MHLQTNPDREGKSDCVRGTMEISEWQSGQIHIEIHKMTDEAIAAVIEVLQGQLPPQEAQVH